MMFDELTWDNSMWKMETSKAMAILGTKFLNPVWHGIGKQEKMVSLEQPRGNFYKT